MRQSFASEDETALHGIELGDRSEHESGKERQRSDHQDGPQPEGAELQRVRAQRADRERQSGLGRNRACHGHHEDDRRVAAEQDDDSSRQIVPRGIGIEPGEGGAVIGRRSGEGVEHLGIAVHRRIAHRGKPIRCDHRPAGGNQDDQGMDQQRERDQDDLRLLDLLAEEFGRPPDHQAGDEDADDAEHQGGEEPHALAAEDALQHHTDKGPHAAERRDSCHAWNSRCRS